MHAHMIIIQLNKISVTMKQPANLFVNKEEENTVNEVTFECRDRSIAVMYRENYNPVD